MFFSVLHEKDYFSVPIKEETSLNDIVENWKSFI